MSVQQPERLRDIGLRIVELFKRMKGLPTVTDPGLSQAYASSEAEADRFQLWAVNLGLFVFGHGALDYRLRDADSLHRTVWVFLGNLERALVEGEN